MHLHTVQRILGVLLMVFSMTMLPPWILSFVVDDGAQIGFTDAFILTFGLGLGIWVPVRLRQEDLRVRDGFLVVVLFWTVLGLTGSLPFLLAENSNMGIADAVFESVSGLTTTGATVIVGIDELPMSILLWQTGSETMSVALWELTEHATSGKVAAYAMMQSGMILVVVILFQLLVRTRTTGGVQ